MKDLSIRLSYSSLVFLFIICDIGGWVYEELFYLIDLGEFLTPPTPHGVGFPAAIL